jgi:hypothetical protein
MPRLVAGRLNTTQCVKVPLGASGSSMIRATLAAPVGTPVQVSGIGALLPRQENLTGIVAPAANAGLRTVIMATLDGVAGPAALLAAGPDPVDPPPDPLQPASRRAASTASAPTAAGPRLSQPCLNEH